MSDTVQQIKERMSIVDVVSQYVELHPAGKNLKGKSPFTAEKTPSFYVSPDRGMYYCFSSSQGGDIFTFVEKMEGVDFKGALKILAEKAGVELVPEDPQKKSERDRQYDVLEAATVFYTEWLHKEPAATAYLERRKVTPQTIAKWRIGYAPGPPQHGWRDTRTALTNQNYTDTELHKAGLIKGGDGGKAPYDTFRDRVMFPVFDPSGRVVGFSGRILSSETEAPKYVNSPETELFNKSEVLFGYDKAKQGIRKFDFSLIVEGQFDVIMSHQAGYTNTVAVSGTALTDHQVGLLQRLSNKAVLALDADRAGVAAAKRGAEIMLARGMDVKVARLPAGADPADMVAAGKGELKAAVKDARHVVEFLLDVLADDSNDERAFKLRAHAEVLPFIVRIPNRIDQEHFETIVAERLKTTKEAVHTEVERLRAREVTAQETKAASAPAAPANPAPPATKVNHSQREALAAHILLVTEVVEEHLAKKLDAAYETITGRAAAHDRSELAPELSSELLFTLEQQYQHSPQTQLRADLAHLLQTYAAMVHKETMRQARLKLHDADLSDTDKKAALQEFDIARKQLGETEYTADYFASPEASSS